MKKLTKKRKRLIEKAVKLVIKEYGETLRLLGKKKGGIPDSLAAAFSIANQGRVGDVVGFTVGKKHFTLIKDTGYVTHVRLGKLKREVK